MWNITEVLAEPAFTLVIAEIFAYKAVWQILKSTRQKQLLLNLTPMGTAMSLPGSVGLTL